MPHIAVITCGYLGFAGFRNIYHDRTGAFAQLEVEHTDGTRTTIVTDNSGRSTRSATSGSAGPAT